jgi:hypothetical protein
MAIEANYLQEKSAQKAINEVRHIISLQNHP